MSSTSSSSLPSSIGHANNYVSPKVTIENGEVHLGEGVTCTLSAWNTMCTTCDETLWGNAFVMGVLKEDAHLYGLMPRNGKMKFPDNFKRAAILHWTEFVLRTGKHELPLSKKVIQSALAKLSARCHDSAGRRNTGKGRPRKEDTPDALSVIINPATGQVEDAAGNSLYTLPQIPDAAEITEETVQPVEVEELERSLPMDGEGQLEGEGMQEGEGVQQGGEPETPQEMAAELENTTDEDTSSTVKEAIVRYGYEADGDSDEAHISEDSDDSDL